MTNEILRVENLVKNFGKLEVLRGVSTSIHKGEVVSIIGPSGGGKSTFLRCLNRLEEPTSGQIFFKGQDITDKKLDIARFRRQIGMVFQNFNVFPHLTVLENIKVAFQSRMYYSMADGLTRDSYYEREENGCDERARELLRVFDMEEMADWNANSLPYGLQRKLEICRAMATNPKLLLLDEPAAGMNPIETQELMVTIQRIREKFGVTILLIEHDMKLVMGICERIYVLNYGRIIAEGTPAEIRQNREVVAAYLGDAAEEAETEKEGA